MTICFSIARQPVYLIAIQLDLRPVCILYFSLNYGKFHFQRHYLIVAVVNESYRVYYVLLVTRRTAVYHITSSQRL